MSKMIHIAILDDHASIIDGYKFRLEQAAECNCKVVATANYGEDLAPMLAQGGIDVLLLDISVPISSEDRSVYPMVDKLEEIVNQNPDTKVLVISMHKQGYLIQHALDAGVAGFVLKDDIEAIRKLGEVIREVHAGSIYISEAARQMIDKLNRQRITSRQLEVLSYFANDPNLTTADVAEDMHIAHSTVRNLLSNTYTRLGVRNLPAAIEKARQEGLLTPNPPDY